MSELKKKSQARNSHRSFVKKVMNNVDELISNNTGDLAKAEACEIALHKQLQEIQKLVEQIVELVKEEKRKYFIAATLRQLHKR